MLVQCGTDSVVNVGGQTGCPSIPGRLLGRVAVGVGLLSLWACGTNSGTPTGGVTPRPVPTGIVGTPGRPADGARLLADLRARMRVLNGLDVEMRASSSGFYYGGVKGTTQRSSASKTRMRWSAPTALRADVLESTTPFLAGATLLMTQANQVRVKAGNPLGLIPISMKPADSRLLTNRNHAFIDNHPVAHLRRLSAEGAVWTGLPPQTMAPGAEWVSISQVRRLDPDVSREYLALSPQNAAPVMLLMYEQNKAVVTFRFERFDWNPPSGKNVFRF